MTVLIRSSISLTIYLSIFFKLQVIAWNFSDVGLSQNVLIWRFTVWRNRAYLAVPRWNKKSIKQSFTLLEAPWPEVNTAAGIPLQFGMTIPEVIPFPDNNSQEEDHCQDLQSITGLDSDSRGRLFVLDAPTRSHVCTISRIVVFDLRRNEMITETELQGVSSRHLKCLKIDPAIVGQAYVSDPGDESIIVYSLSDKNWWKIKLSFEYNVVSKFFVTDLAISKKNSVLYLTGYPSHDLFSIDLENIRNDNSGSIVSSENESMIRHANVSWIGYKLGSSSGLLSDLRGGLHYFMVTELASVRWDSREKLEAENHAIILQSELVPSITDYSFDSQKNVWAIINDRYPFAKKNNNKKYNKKNKNYNNKSLTLMNGENKRRTVKIYKHNPLLII